MRTYEHLQKPVTPIGRPTKTYENLRKPIKTEQNLLKPINTY